VYRSHLLEKVYAGRGDSKEDYILKAA